MEKKLFEKLENFSFSRELPTHDYLFELANRTAGILESECGIWRPCSEKKELGGLLDFTAEGIENLPSIIVPDLHARPYFIFNIMKFVLPDNFIKGKIGLSVFEALSQGLLRVICVGDLLHSELRGKERWIAAKDEFLEENYTGENMASEMAEGLSLLSAVMELKCAFPNNFHILKGNHENIMNVRGAGNYPFRKFANEGEMVRIFMEEMYGDDVVMVIFCFENALPLVAALPTVVVSHAEPEVAFSKKQIINGMSDDFTVRALTWTGNDEAEEGSVLQMLKEFTTCKNPLDAKYIAGHRPVSDKYFLRQNGLFVQIHNPEKQHIALVSNNRFFNPDTDIVSVVSE